MDQHQSTIRKSLINDRTAIVFALAAPVPYRDTSHASTTLRKGESSNGKNQGKEKFREVESPRSLIARTRGSWRRIQQRQHQLYHYAAADQHEHNQERTRRPVRQARQLAEREQASQGRAQKCPGR